MTDHDDGRGPGDGAPDEPELLCVVRTFGPLRAAWPVEGVDAFLQVLGRALMDGAEPSDVIVFPLGFVPKKGAPLLANPGGSPVREAEPAFFVAWKDETGLSNGGAEEDVDEDEEEGEGELFPGPPKTTGPH